MPGETVASANLANIEDRISEACESVSRPRNDVLLVAVSKGRTVPQIRVLYNLGIRDFGESRWQEARDKFDQLPEDIIWHFIGTLQTNKAKLIAQRFSVIHSVTSPRQVHEIEKAGAQIEAFVEVNMANEPSKTGVPVNLLDETVKSVVSCKVTQFRGLMTIGPQMGTREECRKVFCALRVENERVGGQKLSMGMSDDFDVAIMEGSTHVRIGSALFRGM